MRTMQINGALMILDIPPSTAELIIQKAQAQGISVNQLLLDFIHPQDTPTTKLISQNDSLIGQIMEQNQQIVKLQLSTGKVATIRLSDELQIHFEKSAVELLKNKQWLRLTGSAEYVINGFQLELRDFHATGFEPLDNTGKLSDWVATLQACGKSGWQMDNALEHWLQERHI